MYFKEILNRMKPLMSVVLIFEVMLCLMGFGIPDESRRWGYFSGLVIVFILYDISLMFMMYNVAADSVQDDHDKIDEMFTRYDRCT